MKIYLLTICLYFFCLETNAQNRHYLDSVFSDIKLEKQKVYGININFEGKSDTLLFDLYYPEFDTNTNRPLIIISDDNFFSQPSDTSNKTKNIFAKMMANKGYVVAAFKYRTGYNVFQANINYPSEILPAIWRATQDARAIVRYFRKNILDEGNPYKLNANKIVLGGFLGGAIVALQAAYFENKSELDYSKFKDNLGVAYIDTIKLGGFEGNSGTPLFNSVPNVVLNCSGYVLDSNLFDIQNVNIPVISFHTQQDSIVPYGTGNLNACASCRLEVSGAYDITQLLKKHGTNNEFVNVRGDGFPKVGIKNPNNALDLSVDTPYYFGTYTFLGTKNSVPMFYYSTDNTNKQNDAKKYLDTIAVFSSHRLVSILNLDTSIINNNTSIGLQALKDVKIYPNPGNETIEISVSIPSECIVYNITGSKAWEGYIDYKEIINTTSWSSGLYTIFFKSQNSITVHKLIINH